MSPLCINLFFQIRIRCSASLFSAAPSCRTQGRAAQTLIGAARLMLETGRHPGALKDAVCSPGGATIQGVRALEAGGFRSAVMEAVIAAYEKSAEMK